VAVAAPLNPGLYVGEIMDLCNAKEMKTVVFVIPDRSKDIGFNLVSHFHRDPQVQALTF
jgi:hypothetical protein